MDVNAISAVAPPVDHAVPDPVDAARAHTHPGRAAPDATARGTPPQAEPGLPEPDLKFTLSSADAQAKFVVDSASNRVMVTIYNRETGEVIREIPPKRIRDIMAALSGKGVMLDRTG